MASPYFQPGVSGYNIYHSVLLTNWGLNVLNYHTAKPECSSYGILAWGRLLFSRCMDPRAIS